MIEFKVITTGDILRLEEAKAANNVRGMLELFGDVVKDWDMLDPNTNAPLPSPSKDKDSIFKISMEQLQEVVSEMNKVSQVPNLKAENS